MQNIIEPVKYASNGCNNQTMKKCCNSRLTLAKMNTDNNAINNDDVQLLSDKISYDLNRQFF